MKRLGFINKVIIETDSDNNFYWLIKNSEQFGLNDIQSSGSFKRIYNCKMDFIRWININNIYLIQIDYIHLDCFEYSKDVKELLKNKKKGKK